MPTKQILYNFQHSPAPEMCRVDGVFSKPWDDALVKAAPFADAAEMPQCCSKFSMRVTTASRNSRSGSMGAFDLVMVKKLW